MSRPQVPLQDRQGVARHHQHAEGKTYQPLPVRRQLILKAGQPGKFRPLGIPAIYDRVCHQAPLNRLEPIFEPVIDDASFGYRKGRSTKDSLRKIWKELGAGSGVDPRRGPERLLRSRIVIPLLQTHLLDLSRPELLK